MVYQKVNNIFRDTAECFLYHNPIKKDDSKEERLINSIILLRKFLKNDLAFLFLLDNSKKEVTTYFSLEYENEPPWRKMKWNVDNTISVLFSGKTPQWEKNLSQFLLSMLNKGKFESMMVRPIDSPVDNPGLLGVASFTSGSYTEEHTTMLDFVAQNISFCWENKELQNSSRRLDKEMDALIRFSQYLSSYHDDKEAVLEKILNELKAILQVENCGVLLYDPKKKALVLQKPSFSHNKKTFKFYTLPTLNNNGEGIGVGVKVFLTGEPYICNMTEQDSITNQKIARIFNARNTLSVPLIADNRRIGVLHAVNKEKGDFTSEDARLLELLAYQLATVMDNSHLLHTLENKNKLLRHSMDVHKELTKLVLKDRDFNEIVFTLAQLIERDVIVQDQFFKILGVYLSQENENLALVEKSMAESLWQKPAYLKLMEQVNKLKQTIILPSFPKNGLMRCRLIAPITVGDNILGYVSILEDLQHKLGEMEYLAIEHAVTVFTVKIMQNKIAYDVEERIKGDFLDDLINKNYHSHKDIMQRASYLGHDLTEQHQVMFIDIDNFSYYVEKQKGNESKLSLLKRRVFEVVSKCLEEKIPASIIGSKSEAIVAVVPLSKKRSFPKLGDVGEFIKERVKSLIPEITVSIGIGRVCNSIDEIKISYQEARRTLFIAKKFGKRDQVINYDSLGAYKILFNVNNMDELQEFLDQTLGALLKYDRAKKNEILIPTLKSYLACNCNNQKTADNLFIHLNTLKYRLQKIQDIGAVDLNDPESRLDLQLALKILEIKNC
ncbi:MAG: helix-turn-helix domain-containing protein [Bacillota bacterium]